MTSTGVAPRIPVKKAVQNALEYMREFSDIIPNQSTTRLEETDYDDDRDDWLVTISYDLDPFGGGERTYKLFRIDAKTGEVTAMKNMRPS